MTPFHQPVLIVNPRSGGGKAKCYDLVGQCRLRGIEPVVFEPDDDLAALATAAVRNGADVLGMAGGDGSQAAVAAVAAEHDIPYVCVAAGTRNHFAFDIGVDRNDVVRGLDAFVEGVERRIDLGRVNGRVFINNVAMGVYGAAVQAKGYRDAKLRTILDMLPEFIGPAAEPFDLRFSGADGRQHDTAILVLVSNNPYQVVRPPRSGTRGMLDGGVLGVVAVTSPPPHGLQEWTTRAFRVDSAETVPLGVDGETVQMEPPLLFESLPRALRIRTSKRPSALSDQHH
ncbi:MAG: diacylglycerol kinase family protein [Acidimicrobiales bacterium]